MLITTAEYYNVYKIAQVFISKRLAKFQYV